LERQKQKQNGKFMSELYLPTKKYKNIKICSVLSPLCPFLGPAREVRYLLVLALFSVLDSFPVVVCGGVDMGWNRSWLVESKEFKFALKDSSPVLTIQERRRGVQRAVNLRIKEQVWLVRIFGELVAVEDSRVFRDQTVPGFPQVLAQKCGNRNERFLVIEEYNGRGNAGLFLCRKEETDEVGISLLRSFGMSYNFLLTAGKLQRKKEGIQRSCVTR
jgi:hypothetical protein